MQEKLSREGFFSQFVVISYIGSIISVIWHEKNLAIYNLCKNWWVINDLPPLFLSEISPKLLSEREMFLWYNYLCKPWALAHLSYQLCKSKWVNLKKNTETCRIIKKNQNLYISTCVLINIISTQMIYLMISLQKIIITANLLRENDTN